MLNNPTDFWRSSDLIDRDAAKRELFLVQTEGKKLDLLRLVLQVGHELVFGGVLLRTRV